MRAPNQIAVLGDGTSIRLTAGGHSSPRNGVCVVELASMIAGEAFSDRPRCVCPVIAALLRGLNDRAGHAERQRLSPYAVRIVGSRGDRRVTRERRQICLEWAAADSRHGRVRHHLRRIATRVRIAVLCGARATFHPNEGVGDYAARLAFDRRDLGRALDLLDALLAVGGKRQPTQLADAIRRTSHARDNGAGLPMQRPNGNARSAANGASPIPSNGSKGSEADEPRRPAVGAARSD
jgi:hypothetical protein